MKIRILVICLLLSAFLFDGLLFATEGRFKGRELKKVEAKPTFDALKEIAKVKIMYYRWQLEALKDIEAAEQQLAELKDSRIKLQRTVEKLEFISRIREREGQSTEIGRVENKDEAMEDQQKLKD